MLGQFHHSCIGTEISTDGLPFEAFAVQLSPFEAFGVQLTKISWTKGETKALCNMTSLLTWTRNKENPLTLLLLRKVILFLLHLQSQSTTAVLIELMNATACIGLSFVNLNAAIEGEGSADKCIGSGSRRRWLWWWPWMTHCSRNCNCTDTAVEHVACTKKMVVGGRWGTSQWKWLYEAEYLNSIFPSPQRFKIFQPANQQMK